MLKCFGMKQIFTIFTCLFFLNGFAQFTDDFSDGDFTADPVWSGNDALFLITSTQLQSNSLVADTFSLSTPSTLAQNAQWEFFVNLKFSTSGVNYTDVYLMADQADMLLVQNGYFVRIGDTKDDVSLYNIVAGDTNLLINGVDALVNSSSNNPLKIKVTRDASDLWTLDVDDGLTGSFTTMGSVTNNAVNSSSFFGIKIVQSSAASAIAKHFYDDFAVGSILVDVTPPSINSVNVLNATQVDILFSESVEQSSAENAANYQLLPANTLVSALRDAVNLSLVHLTFTTAFGDGVQQTLTCNAIADLTGNAMSNQQINFTYSIPQSVSPGDVLINEFFCDPSPRVGLAELEFVEIYNKSSKTLNLKNWKLGDASGDGTVISGTIAPGEYKVLCATSAIDSFPNSLAVTSFPSLNNTGDDIYLKDSNGVILDHLKYDLTWYNDPAKENGGYTVELVNPFNFCAGSNNWMASIDSEGGTPGAQNSVYNLNPDFTNPTIVQVDILPPNFISIGFSEKMDSLSLVNAVITVNPSLTIANRFISESYPQSILLEFNQNFVQSQLYTITLNGVADCSQNDTTLTTTFVLALSAAAGDLVINEILADPLTNGSDFIEIRNNSEKLIDLKDLELANYDNDTIANQKKIVINYVLLPGDYVVLTPDSSDQKINYPATVPGKFIQMSLPTYSNDSGTVYLLNGALVLDKVSYTSDWHFALLSSTDGKSLERMDPFGQSNNSGNWHTAAETIGFATPGRENSQVLYGEQDGVLSLTKDIFSPDNDGLDDVLQINYSMLTAGLMADMRIYDDRGRLIKSLFKAELLGTEGHVIWDGLTEDKQKASIGTYILYMEGTDINGKSIAKKIPFVLAGKL